MSGDLILLRCKSCRTVNRLPPDKLDSNPICGKCKTPLEYPRLPVHGTALNFEQEVLEWHGVSLVELVSKVLVHKVSPSLLTLTIHKSS